MEFDKKLNRISVIMGLYNCESTLKEALDSLLAQTYKHFVVIMCDDGSSDRTFDIAKRYTDRYDNFILIRNYQNLGLNYTLNKCLEYVKTEFVARMDGDDISLPTRFEKEIDALDRFHNIEIVSTAMIHFDESGDFMVSKPRPYPVPTDLVHGTPFCHAPCMVRKNAYDAVRGYTIDKKLLRVEDYHLWFKMYSKGFRGYNIKEPLYKMRDDRNAYTRRKFKYRLNEAYVISEGCKLLKLPFYYQIYALRPLIVGIMPRNLYSFLRKIKHMRE